MFCLCLCREVVFPPSEELLRNLARGEAGVQDIAAGGMPPLTKIGSNKNQSQNQFNNNKQSKKNKQKKK